MNLDRFVSNFSGAFGVDLGWDESMSQRNHVVALGIRDALARERRHRGGRRLSDKDISEILGLVVTSHVDRTNPHSEEPEPRIFRSALILRVAQIRAREAIRDADDLAADEADRFIKRVQTKRALRQARFFPNPGPEYGMDLGEDPSGGNQ